MVDLNFNFFVFRYSFFFGYLIVTMCSRVLAKSSLPEKLEFLAPLLGTWKGKGQGVFF